MRPLLHTSLGDMGLYGPAAQTRMRAARQCMRLLLLLAAAAMARSAFASFFHLL